MSIQFEINGNMVVLEVEPDGDGYRVRLPDGTAHYIHAIRLPDDILQITQKLDDSGAERVFRIPLARTEQGASLSYGGQTFTFSRATARPVGAQRGSASGTLTAPMVGMVTEVLVEEGQQVEAYQPLVAVEAMKVVAMLDAPFAGTVRKLYVAKGQRIDHGAPLVELIPSGE